MVQSLLWSLFKVAADGSECRIGRNEAAVKSRFYRSAHLNWRPICTKVGLMHYKNQSAISPYMDASGKLAESTLYISINMYICIY